MKRSIAILLIMLMLCSIFPGVVFASTNQYFDLQVLHPKTDAVLMAATQRDTPISGGIDTGIYYYYAGNTIKFVLARTSKSVSGNNGGFNPKDKATRTPKAAHF